MDPSIDNIHEICQKTTKWADIQNMKYNRDHILYSYCKSVNHKIVKKISHKWQNLNWNMGLLGICQSNSTPTTPALINVSMPKYEFQTRIIMFMVQNGANDLNVCFDGALEVANIEILQIVMKYIKYNTANWHHFLTSTCSSINHPINPPVNSPVNCHIVSPVNCPVNHPVNTTILTTSLTDQPDNTIFNNDYDGDIVNETNNGTNNWTNNGTNNGTNRVNNIGGNNMINIETDTGTNIGINMHWKMDLIKWLYENMPYFVTNEMMTIIGLTNACENNNPVIAKLILENYKQISKTTSRCLYVEGMLIVLNSTCEKFQYDPQIIQLLIDNGILIDTILRVACKVDNIDIIKLYFPNGDIYYLFEHINEYMSLACRHKCNNIILVLLDLYQDSYLMNDQHLGCNGELVYPNYGLSASHTTYVKDMYMTHSDQIFIELSKIIIKDLANIVKTYCICNGFAME